MVCCNDHFPGLHTLIGYICFTIVAMEIFKNMLFYLGNCILIQRKNKMHDHVDTHSNNTKLYIATKNKILTISITVLHVDSAFDLAIVEYDSIKFSYDQIV